MFEKMKFLALLLPLVLVGCGNDDGSGKINVAWQERGVVYVADANIGAILALARDDSGRLLARTNAAVRTTLLDMQLDKEHEHLWVLRANSVDVHDARSLDLKKHITLRTGEAVSLHQNAGSIGLYSKSGALVGQIDAHTMVASWRNARMAAL